MKGTIGVAKRVHVIQQQAGEWGTSACGKWAGLLQVIPDCVEVTCRDCKEVKMGNKIIYFDSEIVREIKNNSDWEQPELLGLACGCTFSEEDGYLDWLTSEGSDLLEYLQTAQLVVTFNGIRFDYRVLAGDITTHKKQSVQVVELLKGKSVDIFLDLYETLGKMISLQKLSTWNLTEGKSGDGGLAPVMWAQKRRTEVLQYCRRDVELTRRNFLIGKRNKGVRINESFVNVDWKVR